MKVALGADHGGLELKEKIKSHLLNKNIEIIDNDFQQITVTVTSAGVLHVTGANGYVLQVYNVLGVRVASIKVEGNDKRIDLPLKSGCYIVKVGNVVRKISINR